MQLYFMTRGIKHAVDRFITELQGKYLPIKLKVNEKGGIDPNGVEKDMVVQLSVRPIQLWEVAYPKEFHDIMLNTIFAGSNGTRPEQKEYRWIDKLLYPLRKALRLTKIDTNYSRKDIIPVYHDAVDTIAIGYREDYQAPWGEGL